MKNILVTLLMLLPVLTGAQTSIQKALALSPGYDAGQVLLPTSGGYAIFGRQAAAPGARTDVFFLRVDADGNQLAYKKYGDDNASESMSKGVVAMPNGWLLAGSKTVISSIGWLLRLNAAGDVLWSKEVPGTSKINQIAVLPGGGVLATGQTSGGRMFLMKLADDGSVVWQQNYTPGEGRDLYITAGGNACVVLGSKNIWKVHLVSKLLQWEQSVAPPAFGPTGQTEFFALSAIAPAGNGRFAIIGSAYTELPTELYTGHFAAVWSETGVPIWQKFLRDRATGYDQNEGTSIFYLPNSTSILFAGTDQGKAVVTRTDLKGKILEENVINAPGEMYNVVLIKDAGRYVMTGAILTGGIDTYYYRSADNELSMSAPTPSGPIQRANAEGIRLLQRTADTRITAEMTLEADRMGHIRMWDGQGRLVLEKQVALFAGLNRVELDTDGLAPGLYWLHDVNSNCLPKALVVRK